MTASALLSREHWLEVVERAPLVSIDLVCRDPAGQVLLGLRRNEPARGCWFTPGGAVRKNERLDDAFARIARTELGITLRREQARLLGVFEHFYAENFAGAADVDTHYVVLAHEITIRSPLQPDSQHEALRWMDPRDLVAAPDVHRYVKQYFAP